MTGKALQAPHCLGTLEARTTWTHKFVSLLFLNWLMKMEMDLASKLLATIWKLIPFPFSSVVTRLQLGKSWLGGLGEMMASFFIEATQVQATRISRIKVLHRDIFTHSHNPRQLCAFLPAPSPQPPLRSAKKKRKRRAQNVFGWW